MAAGRPNKKAVAVKKLLEKDPTMSAVKIAEKVGCHPYYVGKVKRDMGLTKPRKKKRVSTQAATLGSARKSKKKALPKTTKQQRSDNSNFTHHEKKVIQHLGQFDTVAKTMAETRYSRGFIERTKKKAMDRYADLLVAKEALCEPQEFKIPDLPDYSRGGLLDRAKEIVTNDRQNTHGQPEDSFRRIADLWSGYLTVGVHEQDVAVMMALVKVARIMENPQHADNWIDGAGYFACGGEVALRKN